MNAIEIFQISGMHELHKFTIPKGFFFKVSFFLLLEVVLENFLGDLSSNEFSGVRSFLLTPFSIGSLVGTVFLLPVGVVGGVFIELFSDFFNFLSSLATLLNCLKARTTYWLFKKSGIWPCKYFTHVSQSQQIW